MENVQDGTGAHEATSQVHTVSAADARFGEALAAGRHRVADGFERVGEQLEERAREFDELGGLHGQASVVVRRTGAAFDSSADYIRTHEPAEMRDDLEEAIRDRPLMSVGLALGAGFLLAKVFRS